MEGNYVVEDIGLSAVKYRHVRGRLFAELLAMLGDMLEVTAEVAQQLRSQGGFDILLFRLLMDGGFNDRDVHVADRFDLLRHALGAILSLGLKYTVAADALWLVRTRKLDACFVDAST